MKLFRRLEPGVNPEIEVGRFLTETVSSPTRRRCSALSSWMTNGARSAVAVVHGFVENQGDAWTVTGAYLDRFVEEQRLLTAEAAGESDEQAAICGACSKSGDAWPSCSSRSRAATTSPEFAPEPITRRRRREPGRRASCSAPSARSMSSDDDGRDLTENDRQLVDALLVLPSIDCPRGCASCCQTISTPMKIRHHGDFHLGQMLIVKDDVFIIDFEGEPRRSIEDRRRKARRRVTSPGSFARSIIRQPPRSSARSGRRPTSMERSHARSMAGANGPLPHFSRPTGEP